MKNKKMKKSIIILQDLVKKFKYPAKKNPNFFVFRNFN